MSCALAGLRAIFSIPPPPYTTGILPSAAATRRTALQPAALPPPSSCPALALSSAALRLRRHANLLSAPVTYQPTPAASTAVRICPSAPPSSLLSRPMVSSANASAGGRQTGRARAVASRSPTCRGGPRRRTSSAPSPCTATCNATRPGSHLAAHRTDPSPYRRATLHPFIGSLTGHLVPKPSRCLSPSPVLTRCTTPRLWVTLPPASSPP
jgi:hypothetical protein